MDMLTKEIATRHESIDFYALGSFYLPNPDPVLKKQGKDITVYNDLASDGHLSGCISSRKAGVTSLNWEIIRGDTSTNVHKKIIAIIENLESFDNVLKGILDSVQFGYQVSEVLWIKKGGLIVPSAVVGKPQNWFVFSEENELRFLTKSDMIKGISLPPRKFILSTHNATYENPYGDAVLSKCFWPVTFKKGGMKFWITFCEKYGMPFLQGKIKRGAPPEEYDALLERLMEMVQDAVAVIPDDSSIEFLDSSSKSASSDIFNTLIESCKSEISIAQLGQNLTTEVKGGSYAASQSHMQVREDIVDSDKKIVESAINTLIRWICEINFNTSAYPRFSLYKKEDVDKSLAERDEILTKTGVKFTKKYYIKNYGLDEEDITIDEQPADVQPPPSPETSFSEQLKQKFTSDQQCVEDLISHSLTHSEHAFNSLLSPVQKMIEESNSIEEARDKLFSMHEKMDSSEVSDLLARAIFISEIWGRINNGE